MRDMLTLLAHLMATLARLLGPGGVKAVVAEKSPAQTPTAGYQSSAEASAQPLRLPAAAPGIEPKFPPTTADFNGSGPAGLVLPGMGWLETCLCLDQPGTVIRWHRAGFRLFWRRKGRPRKAGRKTFAPAIITLIRDPRTGRANLPA